jgi:ABC-type oligopeptide transport system substrate-binding subunit
MRPSADAGYGWDKPEFEVAMDEAAQKPDKASRYVELAEAEKILLDDYIFAPISIEPYRHLVKPNVKGFGTSAAGYHNSQWMTLE